MEIRLKNTPSRKTQTTKSSHRLSSINHKILSFLILINRTTGFTHSTIHRSSSMRATTTTDRSNQNYRQTRLFHSAENNSNHFNDFNTLGNEPSLPIVELMPNSYLKARMACLYLKPLFSKDLQLPLFEIDRITKRLNDSEQLTLKETEETLSAMRSYLNTCYVELKKTIQSLTNHQSYNSLQKGLAEKQVRNMIGYLLEYVNQINLPSDCSDSSPAQFIKLYHFKLTLIQVEMTFQQEQCSDKALNLLKYAIDISVQLPSYDPNTPNKVAFFISKRDDHPCEQINHLIDRLFTNILPRGFIHSEQNITQLCKLAMFLFKINQTPSVKNANSSLNTIALNHFYNMLSICENIANFDYGTPQIEYLFAELSMTISYSNKASPNDFNRFENAVRRLSQKDTPATYYYQIKQLELELKVNKNSLSTKERLIFRKQQVITAKKMYEKQPENCLGNLVIALWQLINEQDFSDKAAIMALASLIVSAPSIIDNTKLHQRIKRDINRITHPTNNHISIEKAYQKLFATISLSHIPKMISSFTPEVLTISETDTQE